MCIKKGEGKFRSKFFWLCCIQTLSYTVLQLILFKTHFVLQVTQVHHCQLQLSLSRFHSPSSAITVKSFTAVNDVIKWTVHSWLFMLGKCMLHCLSLSPSVSSVIWKRVPFLLVSLICFTSAHFAGSSLSLPVLSLHHFNLSFHLLFRRRTCIFYLWQVRGPLNPGSWIFNSRANSSSQIHLACE